jgi:uncharacterized membrane protein YphA (DoxX/SURF4 family)
VPKSSGRKKPPARPRAASTRTRQPPVVPQPAPGLRGKVERASAPVLLWLSARPRWFIPVLSGALLVAGLFAPPAIGVPLLLLLVAFVGWLSYLSWPVVPGRQRLVRLVMLGLLLFAVAGRLDGA